MGKRLLSPGLYKDVLNERRFEVLKGRENATVEGKTFISKKEPSLSLNVFVRVVENSKEK